MKKMLNKYGLLIFLVPVIGYSTILQCPPIVHCKSDHFYSCIANSNNFEISPTSSQINKIKPGIYVFSEAVIYGGTGTAHCTYVNNASSIILNTIPNELRIETKNLSKDWEIDSFRGHVLWSCSTSSERCDMHLKK